MPKSSCIFQNITHVVVIESVEMLMKLIYILSWTGKNLHQKNIHDAERILAVAHLIKCGINHEKCNKNVSTITAYCIQTSHMKEKPHEINAMICKYELIIQNKYTIQVFIIVLSRQFEYVLFTLIANDAQ